MPRDIQQRARVSDPSVPDWKAVKEQDELDEMSVDLRQRYNATASVRLAYIPAVGSLLTLITSMFLHAGILHLLGNMVFLFATAPFVEDAFGRILFFALYVTGGIVATLSFAWRFPNTITPLVGASGAISAVMGAYLIRFAQSRMQLLVVPVIFLPFWNFRFSVPALVLLPIWFLEQVVSIPAEGNSGVAVTAHVAGFAYGLLFAGVIKLARVEDRWIRPGVGKQEKQVTFFADPRLERARAPFRAGDVELASREVNHLLADQPKNRGALRLALDIELRRNDSGRVDALGTRLLEAHALANEKDLAVKLIGELRATKHARQFLSRSAALMERWEDRRTAIELLERLAQLESGTANAVPTLVKLATLRRSIGDRPGAQEALQRALAQPACTPEWRRRIDSSIALL